MLYDQIFPLHVYFDGEEGGGGTSGGTPEGSKPEGSKPEGSKPEGSKPEGSKETYSAEYVERLRREAATERQKAQEAETKRAEAQAQLDKHAKEKLQEEGKFKEAAELAEKRAAEAEAREKKAQETAERRFMDSEIKLAAQEAGAVDPADVLLFIDRANIKIDGDSVVGAKEAVAALKESKKHLFMSPEEVKAQTKGAIPPKGSKKPSEPINAFDMKPDEFERAWKNSGKVAA